MEPQQTNPIPVPTPQVTKSNHKIFYILIFVFIALVGSAVYLFLQNPKKEVAQSIPIQNGVEEWKTYRNEEYGFEFKYPEDGVIEKTNDIFGVLSKLKIYGVEVYVSNKESIASGEKKCSQYEGECYSYVPKCIENNCHVFTYIKQSQDPILVNSTLYSKNGTQVEFSQNYYLDKKIGGDSLNMDQVKQLIDSKEISKENFDIFNKIVSTFKFIDNTDISNWKTYRNEEYGFEFKYPKNFDLQNSIGESQFYGGGIGIENNGVPVLTIGIIDEKKYSQSKRYLDGERKDTIISVGGRDAILSCYLGGCKNNNFNYYVIHNSPVLGKVLTLNFGTSTEVKQILSTFKFIDNADISNWKTYRNEEYGFEFKYPSEWTSKYHEIDEITYFGTGNKPDDYPSELNLSTYPSFNDLKETYSIKENDVFSWRQSSGYPLSVKNLNDKKWICNDHEGDGPGDVMSCVFEDKNKVLYFMNFSLDAKTMDKILSTFKFTK